MIHDEGLEVLLTRALVSGASLTLKLYTAVAGGTLTSALINSDFTEETGGGYASLTLTNSSWTVSSVGGIPQALHVAKTFTFTGAATAVIGYYITDGTKVWGAESFASFTPANNGDNIVITPKLTSGNGTPT